MWENFATAQIQKLLFFSNAFRIFYNSTRYIYYTKLGLRIFKQTTRSAGHGSSVAARLILVVKLRTFKLYLQTGRCSE